MTRRVRLSSLVRALQQGSAEDVKGEVSQKASPTVADKTSKEDVKEEVSQGGEPGGAATRCAGLRAVWAGLPSLWSPLGFFPLFGGKGVCGNAEQFLDRGH